MAADRICTAVASTNTPTGTTDDGVALTSVSADRRVNEPRRLRVEVEADGVGPGVGRGAEIVGVGQATDFDADSRHSVRCPHFSSAALRRDGLPSPLRGTAPIAPQSGEIHSSRRGAADEECAADEERAAARGEQVLAIHSTRRGTLFTDFERSKLMPPALSARLADVESQFVDLWGTMSSLWGINPTMARIHGLLYITGEALTMDEMMDRLGISRGNVSMNLTKLVEWGLVQRVHRRGRPPRPVCVGVATCGRCSRGWRPSGSGGRSTRC